MVILNFLAAVRTGRARDLGEQENWGEAFQKTDTYANLALICKNEEALRKAGVLVCLLDTP